MRDHYVADVINMSIQSYGSQSEEERIQAVYAGRHDDQRNLWFREGDLFMIQSRERRLLVLLKKYRLSSLGHVSVLEVGCGTAAWVIWAAINGAKQAIGIEPESDGSTSQTLEITADSQCAWVKRNRLGL